MDSWKSSTKTAMVILCNWNTPIVFRHTYRSWTNLIVWNPPTLGIWQRKPLYSRCKHSHPLVFWARHLMPPFCWEHTGQQKNVWYLTCFIQKNSLRMRSGRHLSCEWMAWFMFGSLWFLKPSVCLGISLLSWKIISMEEGFKIEVINKEIVKWRRKWNINYCTVQDRRRSFIKKERRLSWSTDEKDPLMKKQNKSRYNWYVGR